MNAKQHIHVVNSELFVDWASIYLMTGISFPN